MSHRALTFTRISVRSCKICGTPFLSFAGGPRRYCSPGCAQRGKKGLPSQREESLARRKDRPVKAARTCLRCQQSFDSWGKANRVCQECRAFNREISRTYAEIALTGQRGAI